MTTATNSAMELIIIAFLFIFDAIETLLSGINKGFLQANKIKPPKKSLPQLNKMLKKDLILLVQQYQVL